MEDNITTQDLFDKGFVRKRQGICGQDQWAGMDLWIYQKDKNLVLRGSIGDLKLNGYYNSSIKTKQELDILINTLTRFI